MNQSPTEDLSRRVAPKAKRDRILRSIVQLLHKHDPLDHGIRWSYTVTELRFVDHEGGDLKALGFVSMQIQTTSGGAAYLTGKQLQKLQAFFHGRDLTVGTNGRDYEDGLNVTIDVDWKKHPLK